MRLSTVFELLLIFLLIAFAAYGRVIDRNEVSLRRMTRGTKQNYDVSFMSLKQLAETANRNCRCMSDSCSCCANPNISLFAIRGPACVSMKMADNDKLAVQLSVGNNILTTRMISGNRPQAICVPLPGALTRFCGRIYGIKREDPEGFKSCLGLELQDKTSKIEASVKVSCFRFSSDGIELRPAEPLPLVETPKPAEDDDDDDYDIFDLEDSDETPSKQPGQSTEEDDDDDDDDDDEDILGFDSLLDLITGEEDSKKKPTTTTSVPFTIPVLKPTSSPPKPVDLIPLETKKPTKMPDLPITAPAITELTEVTTGDSIKYETTISSDDDESPSTSEAIVGEDSVLEETTAPPVDKNEDKLEEKPEPEPTLASEVITTVVSPLKPVVKKIIGIKTVKKPLSNPNAITHYTKKPLVKPSKPDPVEDSEEDDADYLLESDSEEDDDETEPETAEEDEDESEEEEEEVLTALVADDDDDEETKDEKISDNEAFKPEDDDTDFGMNLDELLKKRSARQRGRQSKVMRL